MLSKLVIKNFKSIEECELELKPLTILTGHNASGKSNLMEAIALLAQAVRSRSSTLDKAIARSDFFRYPSITSIIYKQNPFKTISFEIHIKPSENLKSKIGKINKNLMAEERIDKKTIASIGYFYSLYNSVESYQAIFVNDNKLIEIKHDISTDKIIYPTGYENYIPDNARIIFDNRGFTFKKKEAAKITPKIDINDYSKLAKHILDEIIEVLEKLYVLSTLRGEITVARADGDPEWIGKKGRELILILSKCFARRSYDSKSQKIIKWANEFEIEGIKAGYWGDSLLGSDYLDPKIKTALPISVASYGSRQILTIITQLFWSDSGSIIMIEEPEISLHPKAQVKLQELFSEAIHEDKQIICSTHSPFLILALSKIIKNKSLTVDDIVIYEVKKGKYGTKADKLRLNNKGFIEGGVPTFMEVESDLYQEWMESLEEEEKEKE